jgi:predicted dehydrogenase
MAIDNNTPRVQRYQPIRIGIIGMGGFAGFHHDVIQQLETEGKCKLICTCDPDPGAFMDRMHSWEFTQRDVLVFDNYLDMLDTCAAQLDLVTIPTPVPLHAEMHRACVERGLAVYLEKPPTLNDAEMGTMLAVEAGAHWQTNVGFNYIVESPRQALKRRIIQGEFGRLQKVCFTGLWARTREYFQRNNWAGRLMLNGKPVLDSCMGNAMAHYTHNVLFWAGQKDVFDWPPITEVRAELYRAHNIQGADTFFVVAKTADDVTLQLMLTHAYAGPAYNPEQIICENATITYIVADHYEIRYKNGTVESHDLSPVSLRENIAAHLAYLRGDGLPHAVTRLIDARPFVHLNDLAYLASGQIGTIPAQYWHAAPSASDPGEWVGIDGIASIAERFFATGEFPSQQHVPWAHAGGTATRQDLPNLLGLIQRMANQRDEGTK